MDRRRPIVLAIIVCTLWSPVRSIAQTPVSPEGWVVLPVDEYRALRERANPQPPQPANPPVDATLTRVDYDLRVENESMAGRALLTIDVLRDGWTRVQIPAGLMVRDARLDGQPVSLVEGPPPYVLLSQAGRVVLSLDIVIPLASSAGTESIALPPSAAPISTAVLTLPRSGVDLSVAGGFVGEHTETPLESRWTTFGRPNQPLTLSWKRKIDDRRAEQALRTRARVTTLVALGEDVSQVTAAVRVEVLQGLAREIALLLPAGLVVNQVNGATVGEWDVNASTLRVRLIDPIASETEVVIQGEARLPRDGTVDVPLVRMPSAERETGGIAVDVMGAGEITGRQSQGLEPADPSELGEFVAGRESPSMIGFRLRPLMGSDPRLLTVTVIRYTPQAVLVANVEEARYRVLASEDGRLLVEARYAVRNNQRSFLKVVMPAGSRSGAPMWLDARSAPASPSGMRCCSRWKRDAPEKTRRPSSFSWCTCRRSTAGRTRDARVSSWQRSIYLSPARGSSFTIPRVSVWTSSPARFASRMIPVPSQRRCEIPRRRRSRTARQRTSAGPPACRHSSIGSERNLAAVLWQVLCRCT